MENTNTNSHKWHYLVLTIELIMIAVMIIILMFLIKTPSEGPKVTVLNPEELSIPEKIVQEKEEEVSPMKGYLNIALFGVDAEKDKQLFKGSRSDSTMIASINLDTGDIKLCSVYRDTYLNIGDEYRKCNAAYSLGGALQAIKMLNSNLDMDIENFISVNYKGLSEVIDSLGGIYIDIDRAEISYLNDYQISVSKVIGCDYTPIQSAGYQLVNGVQAAAYCRIRATAGSDFKRTERQREVIKAIEARAKEQDPVTLLEAFNACIDDIYTNIEKDDLLTLMSNLGNYRIVEEGGFPTSDNRTTANLGADGNCIIPMNLESNVQWLHQFFFEDTEYEVSDTIKEFDADIQAKTAKYRR
ncbi:MAG: LCP family protein [Acetatifactor sp.]|nr:LCP family protein [Acetatifactor sp.]